LFNSLGSKKPLQKMATRSVTEKTLYARLGGYDVLAAVVDEFSQSFSADPRMARFVSGMSLERRKRNRQLTIDYLCAASGGPAFYLGQDMKTAHAGLEISSGEWGIAMDHVRRAISKLVSEKEGKELLALFLDAADQIIERR
jgi:hemoglobin